MIGGSVIAVKFGSLYIAMGKELIVPLLVVGALASILVPMPPGLMDFLIVGNLIWAMVLLMSTLYLTDTLKLSALPSMLLLATLYRLALNISTTRNILSTGKGGQVIEAFGDLVVGGNLIVGAVVFLIITLVQFIVIAKGSERVAEVSARFTLDALPGKQMSIDADVRAGILDMNAARVKRQELQVESRFYGALDGAMKFIKGDAIAGMIIITINIFGGLAIGMFTHGMDFEAAVAKYSLLTIGDGLSAQIPALLNSLAAGIVVTRVGRGDDASLANELVLQLGQIQSVKILIGLCSLGIAFVPGMPALPFITLAGILLIAAFTGMRGNGANEAKIANFCPRPVALLSIEIIGQENAALVGSQLVLHETEVVRQRLFDTHGLIVPFPEFTHRDGADNVAILRLRGVVVGQVELSGPERERVVLLGNSLEELVVQRAAEIVDDIFTRKVLDNFDPHAPELVTATVPGIVSVTQLTEILRSLIRDSISIRNIDVILQAVAEHGPKAQSEGVLLEEVRIALRALISNRCCNNAGEIEALVLEPVIDISIAKIEREKGQIDFNELEQIVNFVRSNSLHNRVVVVSRGSRRIIRECLRMKGLDIPVIAFEEIADGVRLKVVAQYNGDLEERECAIEKLAA